MYKYIVFLFGILMMAVSYSSTGEIIDSQELRVYTSKMKTIFDVSVGEQIRFQENNNYTSSAKCYVEGSGESVDFLRSNQLISSPINISKGEGVICLAAGNANFNSTGSFSVSLYSLDKRMVFASGSIDVKPTTTCSADVSNWTFNVSPGKTILYNPPINTNVSVVTFSSPELDGNELKMSGSDDLVIRPAENVKIFGKSWVMTNGSTVSITASDKAGGRFTSSGTMTVNCI
ncbi:TPA: hypothetical protein LVL72_004903 [Klebsiella oxytoca]|nr:hypothetical protein [Klebsiella oxytoca]